MKSKLVLTQYWQPVSSFVLLTLLCAWGIFPNDDIIAAGHVLGENWYSIYNFMLTGAATMLFLRARRTHDNSAWRVLDLALCCLIVSQVLKVLPLKRPDGGGHGFPSGHALTAFAAAWLLMETYPASSPYIFLGAVLVGWSRVEIHEHFTYQVLIGALMGMAIGYAVTSVSDGVIAPRLFRKRAKKAIPVQTE